MVTVEGAWKTQVYPNPVPMTPEMGCVLVPDNGLRWLPPKKTEVLNAT